MYLRFLFSVLTVLPLASVNAEPFAKSNSGSFHGITKEAKNGMTYKAFLGIPYAEPPVGELRFQPPVPLIIKEKHLATEFKPFCIQINVINPSHDFGQGKEDCLYLNIYTPESAEENGNLKKVLVFIHGGGNMNGFSDLFIPGRLVTEKDIIVVTINYRLGFLGFLSTLTPDCEGNYGLMDQLLAISWVKENIANFGGDPYDITISGESSGGIDVSLLSLVPQSKGLFSRAFSMSGMTGVAQPLVVKSPVKTFIQLSRQVECLKDGEDDPNSEQELAELLTCLKEVPASQFGTVSTFQIPDIGPVIYGSLFPASIENLFQDKNYLDSIKFFDRDYLISLLFNEGDIFNAINDHILSLLPDEQRQAMPPNSMYLGTVSSFLTNAFGPVSQQVVTKVAEYYNKNYEVNPLADFAADAIFNIPTLQWATAATEGLTVENSKVYMFRVVHWPKMMTGPIKGFVHGCDLMYLFDIDPDFVNKIINLQINGSLWDESDEFLKNTYLNTIGDFIKTGNPSLTLVEDLPTGWPAFDGQDGHYLQFGLTPQIKTKLKSERVQLWSHQIPEWIKEYPIKQPAHMEL
ncbi:hypothetical protein Btru_062547 [Bulinus truncatus]|nr:hypothetical protein Btru_062547 [Bulinus truncatus]